MCNGSFGCHSATGLKTTAVQPHPCSPGAASVGCCQTAGGPLLLRSCGYGGKRCDRERLLLSGSKRACGHKGAHLLQRGLLLGGSQRGRCLVVANPSAARATAKRLLFSGSKMARVWAILCAYPFSLTPLAAGRSLPGVTPRLREELCGQPESQNRNSLLCLIAFGIFLPMALVVGA